MITHAEGWLSNQNAAYMPSFDKEATQHIIWCNYLWKIKVLGEFKDYGMHSITFIDTWK